MLCTSMYWCLLGVLRDEQASRIVLGLGDTLRTLTVFPATEKARSDRTDVAMQPSYLCASVASMGNRCPLMFHQ